eukprot:6201176-Pleurochrysis_carterae.AAC.3
MTKTSATFEWSGGSYSLLRYVLLAGLPIHFRTCASAWKDQRQDLHAAGGSTRQLVLGPPLSTS